MAGLTKNEIMKIVYRYIGVSNGYLGTFSYKTHAEFYSLYCDLNIDPYQFEGTTKNRFISILKDSPPDIQAKIIRGVLQQFPLDENEYVPKTRTKALFDELEDIARRLEDVLPVHLKDLVITSNVVNQAISNVEALLKTEHPSSSVDRIHTAMHGYLRELCKKQNINFNKDDSMNRLLKTIRLHHPAFQDKGPRGAEIDRILNAFANILDALNPIRNEASIAHPNEVQLGSCEAKLVINASMTLLHYLDGKIEEYEAEIPF